MIEMKKFLVVVISILILMGISVDVSAHRNQHASHRTQIVRLYRHAYYELRHHHSYKSSFRKLYQTEYKYHYPYTFRPKAHHRWNCYFFFKTY